MPEETDDDTVKPFRKPNGRSRGLPFLHFDDLQVDLEKRWLIKGVVAMGDTSSWIGGPGKGKSALVTDLALSIAAGWNWRGFRSKGRFGVIYLAFERGDLVKRRLESYKRKHGLEGLPIVVVTVPVNMLDPDAIVLLTDTIAEVASFCEATVGFLVVDTFAKAIAYGGGDENSAKDQNRLRGHLRELQRRTGIHIALIGHTGKDETKGERGSNAGLGDVDVEVRMTGDLTKSVEVTKANDQPLGHLTTFCLETYQLAVDEDGDPITTAIVTQDAPEPKGKPGRPPARLTYGEQIALEALRELTITAGEKPTAEHIPNDARTVDRTLWRTQCFAAGISPDGNHDSANRVAFKRAVEGLHRKRLIGQWQDRIWVAEAVT